MSDSKYIEVVNNSLDGFQEISLRGDIDNYDASWVSYKILNLDSKKLRLLINSFGGSVGAAYTIVTAMELFRRSGGTIETINEGRADSAASWIFAMGDKGRRKIMQFAGVFVHPPLLADGTEMGDLSPSSVEYQELNRVYGSLIDIITATTGNSSEYVKSLMDGNTDMNAGSAVDNGFADEVIKVNNAPKPMDSLNRVQLCDFYNTAKGTYQIIVNNTMEEKEKSKETPPDVQGIVNQRDNLLVSNSELKREIEIKNAEISNLKNQIEEQKKAEATSYVDALIVNRQELKDRRDSLINMALSVGVEEFKAIVPDDATQVVNGPKIDDGIQDEAATEGEQPAPLAAEFKAMNLVAKNEMKRKDPAKYLAMVEAYEKSYNK